MKNKKFVLVSIFSLIIVAFLLLSAFINIHSFRSNYLDTSAKDNVTVAHSVVSQLEYALKYGKTLDNYYGIESVFDELRTYCTYAEQMYIVDANGNLLYLDNAETPSFDVENVAELGTRLDEVKESGSSTIWNERDRQQLLLPIKQGEADAVIAAIGIIYKTDSLESRIALYSTQIYKNALLASIIGIALLIILVFLMQKKLDLKHLKRIIISVVLLSNAIFALLSFGMFSKGYLEITQRTASSFGIKLTRDIQRVVSQGVPYNELYEIERYFQNILGNTQQLDSVRLEIDHGNGTDTVTLQADTMTYNLPADSNNQTARLIIVPSETYIGGKLRDLVLRIAASVITSIMIAGEVVSFILALFTEKRVIFSGKENKTCQPLGIVRGLSFFFALFQYMAMAFVSIVLASIYKPIIILGYELPYDIVMGLPLSIQILTSVFTAWVSGFLIERKGWKPVAVTGVFIISVGTLAAAFSGEPYLFLVSQVIIGTGLGLSKTAFDVYAVLCAPYQDIEQYTANSNAGITVGMSCSSAIGAVIAGSFGYSGAYLVMGVIGCGVALLVLVLGLNVIEDKKKTKELESANICTVIEKKRGSFDLRFFGYLMFMVLPYFFIMMFVDYCFPVYANKQGISTEMIGYIFLLYGMCTSYLGVPICTALAKRIPYVALMTIFLAFTGIGILLFSVWEAFFLAVTMVMVVALADGVMPSQQAKYVYSLRFSKENGFSKAISIEGIFSSGIRGVAPILFGYAMMIGKVGLFVVAMLIIASSALFAFFDKTGNAKESEYV